MFYHFYYFPLGFDLRVRRRGWATWALVAASVLGFWLWRQRFPWLGSHYTAWVYVPVSPHPAALLLNAYLHADWLHLLSNMVALAVFGPPLEERLGAWRMLGLYHLCNLGANMAQGALALVFLPATAGYGILGASGAIAGLLGAVLVRLYYARMRVGYWTFLPLQAFAQAGSTTIPVVFAVLLWFLLQVALLMAQAQGSALHVAVGSHLGGLVSGVALGLVAGLRGAALAEQHLVRGRTYLERAQWYPAQGEFIEYVRRRPLDAEGHLGLARTYRLTGGHARADAHYQRACQESERAGRVHRVEEMHREAVRGNPGFVLAARQQLQLAQRLERALKLEAAEQAYAAYARSYAAAAGAPLALYCAARLARRRGAPDAAQEFCSRLLEAHPQAPEADLVRTEIVRGRSRVSSGKPAQVRRLSCD